MLETNLSIITKQALVDNLAGTPIGKRQNINNIDYAVYPVVLMVEGVHHAVNGTAVYYSTDVLKESVLHWEGRPVPVRHPNVNGNYVRANDPQIEADWAVGRIYNATVSGTKLKGEVWIEVAKAEKVSPGLIMSLDSGSPMEVSTGILVEGDGVAGNWGTEAYTQSITKIIPDHLALLPGDKGACSWEDGCGIRANKKINQSHKESLENDFIYNKIQTRENGMTKLQDAINNLKAVTDPQEILGLVSNMAFEFLDLKKSPVSFSEMEESVREAVRGLTTYDHMGGRIGPYYYVREVYEDSVIYEADGKDPLKLFKRSYTRNQDNTVTLGDDVVEVKEQREFVPINNQGENKMADHKPCCPEKVSEIISNEHTAFTEADKEFLSNLSEDQLEKIHVTMMNAFKSKKQMDEEEAKKMAEEEAKKKAPKANTAQEYIAEAPPEIAALLNAGLAQLESKKAELIGSITANSRNKFTPETLQGMSVDQLDSIAALAAPVDFSVNSAGPGNSNQSPAKEEPYIANTPLFPSK